MLENSRNTLDLLNSPNTPGLLKGVNLLNLLLKLQSLPDPLRDAYYYRSSFDLDALITAFNLEKHATNNLGGNAPNGIAENLNICYHSVKDEQLDIFYPNSLASDDFRPTIVWVHGGAWLSGSKSQVANYLKILASYGYTVVGVNYSIAPEDTYPTPLVQVNDALQYLLDKATEFHIDKDNFALAGDSAGSQIAAQMATVITNPNYVTELKEKTQLDIKPALLREQLKCIVLCCGGYNLESLKIPVIGYIPFIKTAMWSYSGTENFDTDPNFETFSVYNYIDVETFPFAFITAGDDDFLHDQSVELKDKLKPDHVTSIIYDPDPEHYPDKTPPKLGHEYQFDLDTEKTINGATVNPGQDTLTKMVEFLNDHLKPATPFN